MNTEKFEFPKTNENLIDLGANEEVKIKIEKIPIPPALENKTPSNNNSEVNDSGNLINIDSNQNSLTNFSINQVTNSLESFNLLSNYNNDCETLKNENIILFDNEYLNKLFNGEIKQNFYDAELVDNLLNVKFYY